MKTEVDWEPRLSILRRTVADRILEPLRTHGWVATESAAIAAGEYVVISAERAGVSHRVAVMYSSATANEVYRRLSADVECIFVHGDLYRLEDYAYGIETPILSVDEFHSLLIKWNTATSGKFGPQSQDPLPPSRPPRHRTLLSEEPIEAIWLRLRQLTSVSLALKLVAARAEAEGVTLTAEILSTKAEGLAYSLRNAGDYFNSRHAQNVSQRVLNLYYGCMAFAFSEMIAAPKGPSSLAAIEKITTQGHGLCTLDGSEDGLEHVVISTVATGFFASWMKSLGVNTGIFPAKKPRLFADLAQQAGGSWITVEGLFARIPEVSDLFLDIFASKPGWVEPHYDSDANPSPSIHRRLSVPSSTVYAVLLDRSARLSVDDIGAFPGPLSQITQTPGDSGHQFRVAVDASGKERWWDALPLHRSPFQRVALIRPAFGEVGEFRALCTALLYCLSIMVRYRPSVWRRVQEGDQDHLRALVEAFLAVVERVLPEQFLERIGGQPVFVKQPGAW